MKGQRTTAEQRNLGHSFIWCEMYVWILSFKALQEDFYIY